MKKDLGELQKKHKLALSQALGVACASEKTATAISWIALRVRKFRESGAKPARTAVARLNLEFELIEWATNVRVTLEDMDEHTKSCLAKAVGYKFTQRSRTANMQRSKGNDAIDAAYEASDSFADTLLYACDWTVQEVWEGRNAHDRAVRNLVRGVAADWEAATGSALPDVPEDSELWGRHVKEIPHPLWIALDAAKLELKWGAVRVLTNYARGKYPSAGGGVGMWTLSDNVFTDAPE
jgi:hypothetical protein